MVTSEKDTLLDNVTYRKLKLSPSDTIFVGNEFMHGSGDPVYHYNGSEFYLLYDFNVSMGDTLILNDNLFVSQSALEDSLTFQVIIDSVGTIDINGNVLKVIYSHPNTEMGYGGTVIQHIGDIGFFLGVISPSLGVFQFLRCYSDSILNYVDFLLPCNFS